jgi:hypothetical protein
MIYDLTKNFSLVAKLQSKSDIRAFIDFKFSGLKSLMLCQNEGFLSFFSDLKITSDHKLRHVSHIYSAVQTSRQNEMALASYNGLYFVKFEENPDL